MAQRELAGLGETEREQIPSGDEQDMERVARRIARSRGEIGETVRAIRERLTVDHVKEVLSDKMRQSASRPVAGRTGVIVGSGIAFLLLAAKLVLSVRRRRKGRRSRT